MEAINTRSTKNALWQRSPINTNTFGHQASHLAHPHLHIKFIDTKLGATLYLVFFLDLPAQSRSDVSNRAEKMLDDEQHNAVSDCSMHTHESHFALVCFSDAALTSDSMMMGIASCSLSCNTAACCLMRDMCPWRHTDCCT